MEEKKELKQEQLGAVTGGVSDSTGYYFGIQYINQDGYRDTSLKGPFETEEIVKAKCEEEKSRLTASGCVITNVQIIYHEYTTKDGVAF